jgi:ArsR family transcriptional regulator, arsenate/arsenite/antimonite-responsive transcriptional repressor / arsenate reductase (thioredoxin)
MDSVVALRDSLPPSFLRLAGNPLRWRLLTELTRSDRQVRELCARLGQAQSLVSYHLGQLRAGGLVSVRRSSADRRDAYYAVDLAACAELLAAAGAALHPGLGTASAGESPPVPPLLPPVRVLFLCTGNGARSQLAEALLEQIAGNGVQVFSAGSHPKRLHPNAVRAMAERGIDISGRRAKHLSEFAGQPFHYVITLCDKVREVCPKFPGQHEPVHWSIPDPGLEEGTAEQTYPAFQAIAAELSTRIRFFLHLISQSPSDAVPPP